MASSRVLPQCVSENAGVSHGNPVPSTTSLAGADRPVQPSTKASTIPLASLAFNRHASAFLGSAYDALFAAHGPQKWWPGRSRFEIIVGAILTQNTSWTNVERAIRNLRAAHMLSPQAIRCVRSARLARLLRPSGYFRQKTKTLKSFVNFLLDSYGGSLSRLFAMPTTVLRDQLLELRGVGPETADSILLYAGKHPVFVVDAYTRRILQRHGHGHPKLTYDEIRKMFESSLPADHQLFNEFHALIVHVGKNYCRPNDPRCSQCSLSRFLPQSTLSAT